ncbi:hypothetical protein D0Z00_000981 [Geotrichum galactomycetum]|uniref:Uncharacterized protein n=1 Tax=Geotrichum galactomycetum TaxID=27317 RepID=A0ACB6V840_9ASCO|nr:hypothetical protein D0Z00_000981 [Geotrichum candidum]
MKLSSLPLILLATVANSQVQQANGAGGGMGAGDGTSLNTLNPDNSVGSAAGVTEDPAGLLSQSAGSQLEGTWSSKSNAVFTGPDFYDPVDELLIEPALPGISYSFTADGYWEQALYRVTGNPRNPKCPTAVLVFQHGSYEILSNQTLVMTPFRVDGRQLVSDPCKSSKSIYQRYNDTVIMQKWEVYVDPYHGRYRLDLYQYDGARLPPLYLAYKPPMMLPTMTMNPTEGASQPTGSSDSESQSSTAEAAATASSAASLRTRIRRGLENRSRTPAVKKQSFDLEKLWWFGVSLVGVGATGWLVL